MPASMTPPRFYHGTGRPMSWVYLTGTLDAAIWGAELAAGNGRERAETDLHRPAARPDRGRPQP